MQLLYTSRSTRLRSGPNDTERFVNNVDNKTANRHDNRTRIAETAAEYHTSWLRIAVAVLAYNIIIDQSILGR